MWVFSVALAVSLNVVFYSQLKSKVGNILAKAGELRINLNVDGVPMETTELPILYNQSLTSIFNQKQVVISTPFPLFSRP